MGVLGVASLLLLGLIFVGETDAEDTQQVTVDCLDVNVSLDQRLPFLDHGAQFVRRQVHAVEVRQQIAALPNQARISLP